MTAKMRWISFMLGALLLVGAPSIWYLGQPSASAGDVPEAFVVEPDDSADVTEPDEPTAPVEQPEILAEPEPDPEPEEEPEPADVRPAKPVGISAPSLGIEDADLVEVGLDDNRAVEIPEDVQEIGWYNRGPRPGEDGNAFMTSHVDSRTQGQGVLFELRRSEPGDPIVVTHDDGSTSDWVVVARERYTKGQYPLDQVFRFDGPPGLVIDTCGGRFNPSTGSYEEIVAVYAAPADSDAAVAASQS
jgi:hypothetical protein